MNLLLKTDSYKFSHFEQYPPGSTRTSAYVESRGGRFGYARFFGLQGIIKRHLLAPVTAGDIDEATELAHAHGLPFNVDGWNHILQAHGGNLPVEIQAVPEGLDVPPSNVLAQIVNTDPQVPWLVSYLETLLMQLWYPTTVCTLSAHARALILSQLERTADDPQAVIGTRLHDFGARGSTSMESAAIGGLAHLVNFLGTDTVPALLEARRFYHEPMAGFSIPAMEHSTVTAWGRDGEVRAFGAMLDAFAKPGAIVAMVADSYDLDRAVDELIGSQLAERIRTSGATIVVRPDSGDPVEIVPRVLQLLASRFGTSTNAKGFRVLADCVRVIQGDGMDLSAIARVGEAVIGAGFSTENVAYGMGAGLLQKVDRDTMRFAMKTSAIEIDGVWRDVFKAPRTDLSKRSKAGRLALVRREPGWSDRGRSSAGGFETIRLDALGERENLLVPIYRNGELLVDRTFAEIRERALTNGEARDAVEIGESDRRVEA